MHEDDGLPGKAPGVSSEGAACRKAIGLAAWLSKAGNALTDRPSGNARVFLCR